EQWTAGSPWADRRVRLAASLAIDRQAINEAESLGFSGITGNFIPRHQEFALPIDAHPYDPKRARGLLAEAGYPNGFELAEFTAFPPYNSMGEAIANYFVAVGIKTRVRTMERAAFLSAWKDRKLRRGVRGAHRPDAHRGVRHYQGPLLLRLDPRGRGALRQADSGDGPQEARRHAAPDSAGPRRPDVRRADLGKRLHPRVRTADGGGGSAADPVVPVYGTARGPASQEAVDPEDPWPTTSSSGTA